MAGQPDRYARLARWYDPITSRLLMRARKRVALFCREAGFSRVADIGCGTGTLALALHDAGMAVTCFDASPAMLAVAAKRLPASVPLAAGSAPLPFQDNAFDVSLLALVLHESDTDPHVLLREALRIAPCCLVLELRMPERNLDLPAHGLARVVERLAGAHHYARFRNFARLGFLRGVADRVGAEILREEALMAGSLVVALCRMRRGPHSA